jgi:adenine phosphoribosyltransferase
VESWGYIWAAYTALATGRGFAAARRRTDLLSDDAFIIEYGMHKESGRAIGIERRSLNPGARIVVVDDSIVSGGTIFAAARAAQLCGGEVVACLAVTGAEDPRQLLPETGPWTAEAYRWAGTQR